MKKKLTILILILVLTVVFAGCERQYDPDPAVEQYMSIGMTAEGAFAKIAKVAYTTTITVQDKAENIKGTNVLEVEFEKGEDVVYFARQTYTGTLVADKVTEVTVNMSKNEDGYIYDTYTKHQGAQDAVHETKQVEDSFALDLITALVYVNNGAYNEGGLYYGDFFMQRIYRYPPRSFHVDEEQNLCVFDEKMKFEMNGVGEVRLYQTIKINEFGLVVYFYERYESVENDYVMISETIPHYDYVAAA